MRLNFNRDCKFLFIDLLVVVLVYKKLSQSSFMFPGDYVNFGVLCSFSVITSLKFSDINDGIED